MVYIETRTLQGKKYRYLRMSVRVGKRIRKITLRCLGAVNPIYRKKIKKRKTNASIFVRSITKEEKEKLSQALHSSNAFVRDRAKIILLSSGGGFICCSDSSQSWLRSKKSKDGNQSF